MLSTRLPTTTRIAAAIGAVLLTGALATGCQPEPAEPTPSGTVPPSPTDPAPSPTGTEEPQPEVELPASCEDIYSPGMLAALNADNPPLNDPGVTMPSTQNVTLLALLDSGVPTIRCSWGLPSEYGLATNVTLLTAEQAAAVQTELDSGGFGCEPFDGGSICRVEQRGLTLDDVEYVRGETHYVREDGWVSTSWLNFAPEDYTEDIVATIWG